MVEAFGRGGYTRVMKWVFGMLATSVFVGGCAGIRVGPTSWSPPAGAVLPTPEVATYHAVPIADAVVHENPEFAGTALGAESWLMVGRNDAHGWVTYLRFDLTSLRDAPGAASAQLRLPPADDEVLLRSTGAFAVNAYAVVGAWDEDTLTWRTQPRLAATPIATGATRVSGYDVDTFELTEWVNELLRAGETTLDVALVASGEVLDGRRRWPSREAVGANVDDIQYSPRLEVTVGRAPPRPRQADLARSGRD